jgi:hypothetical protein
VAALEALVAEDAGAPPSGRVLLAELKTDPGQVGLETLLREVDKLAAGLSPLFWTHINPYGRFRLDMDTRLDLTVP